MVTQITSAKNPKVKHAYALRERRERDREGVTILEGYRELSRALALGIRIRECFCCPELYLQMMTPVAPTASALRRMEPRLPGFSMVSATR